MYIQFVFDQPHRITTVCNLEIVCNKSVPPPPQIIELSPGTYLVLSHDNRFSICPDTSISYLEPCNMCQIHVKCLCTLNVAHLKVASPLDRCHLPLPAIQVKHGINMALMHHFKLSSPQLVDDSSLSVHPIHLQIPNISHNIQTFQDLTNNQKQAALNLNRRRSHQRRTRHLPQNQLDGHRNISE